MPWGDRADLNKTESHAGKRLVRLGIFVEASRQTDWMIEFPAPNGLAKLWIVLGPYTERMSLRKGAFRSARSMSPATLWCTSSASCRKRMGATIL